MNLQKRAGLDFKWVIILQPTQTCPYATQNFPLDVIQDKLRELCGLRERRNPNPVDGALTS